MAYISTSCFFCILVDMALLGFQFFVTADDCVTLEGKWYNQLGSEINLYHHSDGSLTGVYHTFVERHKGSKGQKTHSKLRGTAPYSQMKAVFGFAVMWNGGASTTAWTGQCMVCNGSEILVTSWLLRVLHSDCKDKWKSTMIGQDYFSRMDSDEYESNVSPSQRRKLYKRDVKLSETAADTGANSCLLGGPWYNELGSEIILRSKDDHSLRGEYRTAVERHRGAAGTSHSEIYGISTFNTTNTTMAMFVVWNNGGSVTGWVGQCHYCSDGAEEIEAAWLLRQRADSCDDNWKSTNYGMSNFGKIETKQGPRKALGIHTPGQEGEDPDDRDTCTDDTLWPWPALKLYRSITCLELSATGDACTSKSSLSLVTLLTLSFIMLNSFSV